MTVSFCPQRRQCCTEFYSCWPINISREWSTVFRLSCCVYMLLGMNLLSWWTSVEGWSSDGLLPMSNRQNCCLRLVLFLCFVISVKAVMLSSAFLFCPFSRTKIIQIVTDGLLWNFEKVWEEFVRLCSWCLLAPVCFVDVRQMACTQRFEPSECFLTAIVWLLACGCNFFCSFHQLPLDWCMGTWTNVRGTRLAVWKGRACLAVVWRIYWSNDADVHSLAAYELLWVDIVASPLVIGLL